MLNQTPTISQFPLWSTHEEDTPSRYEPLPDAQSMKNGVLFGIPLTSALTGQTLSDDALNKFLREAVSELEHILDIYITPTEFQEKHDYNKEMFAWSFAYLKLNHPNILYVSKLNISFNNTFEAPVAVDFPKEFIHVMPQEAVIQLVPATGTTLGGVIMSAFSGIQYHALNMQAFLNYPGSIRVTYTCGFEDGKVPALLAGLIETMAAIRVLSIMGFLLFPYNSVSAGLDGVSQSTSTLGPGFFRQRMDELNKMKDQQLDAARGYYQRKFLIDHI